MGFDKIKIKQIRNLIILTAALILCIIYSDRIIDRIAFVISILTPFVSGIAIAFVINIPMSFFERVLFKNPKRKFTKAMARPLSLILTLILIAAVITVVTVAVIPQLVHTISELAVQIPQYLTSTLYKLEWQFYKYPWITDRLQEIDIHSIDWMKLAESLTGFFSGGVGSFLTNTVDIAGKVVGGVVNSAIAFIFALYFLFQKDRLVNQSKRILHAYVPRRGSLWITKTVRLLKKNFKNFITGQCLEAVIIFVLFFIVLSIIRTPYTPLISVLIAFLSLIPIIGAFTACAVSVLLILMVSPLQALIFVIAFLVVQQLESNLIYPRVVGNSVGLPAVWVLAAVTIGSSLMGLIGMLTFIPLFATIYSLIRDDVNARNNGRTKFR